MKTFTLIHVAISLVGIFSGFVVLVGLLNAKRLNGWTALFLTTTLATSLTGFGFPFDHLLPSHKVGILSIVVLAVAIYARYIRRLAGGWRRTYVISAMLALYFNVFVGVIQAFLKIPVLHAMAPRQTEPPFVAAQLAVMALFITASVVAIKRFRREVLVPVSYGSRLQTFQ